ncbi:DUF1652 domain-containing protein [Pseudomonas syringae]
MMLSHADLRHIMETAFFPVLCTCTINSDGLMTVELSHPRTQAKELTVSDISVAQLTTGRAIATLVMDLREQLRLRQLASPQSLKREG